MTARMGGRSWRDTRAAAHSRELEAIGGDAIAVDRCREFGCRALDCTRRGGCAHGARPARLLGGVGDATEQIGAAAPEPVYLNVSITWMIAGPISTTNRQGRMKRIIGTVMMAGSRAAFSSAFIMRSSRNSAASTRSEWASGVP